MRGRFVCNDLLAGDSFATTSSPEIRLQRPPRRRFVCNDLLARDSFAFLLKAKIKVRRRPAGAGNAHPRCI